MAPLDTFADDSLVQQVVAYVQAFMSNYDASHDWSHILRVISIAHAIYHGESLDPKGLKSLSLRKITLAALLHDIGDVKYLEPGQDGTRMVSDLLIQHGADEELATEIQAICNGVSYRSETKDFASVVALIKKHPDLAAVQDADRLDAIGAVGIGRVFAYGGAMTTRSLAGSVEHFDEKLLLLEALMKTETGRKLAKERTERLRVFEKWWEEESAAADSHEVVLKSINVHK